MLLLDGKKLRDLTIERLKIEVANGGTADKPKLVILQVGDLPESNAFIAQKKLFGEKIGAEVMHKKYENKVVEDELMADIRALNNDKKVHGIIVQLPIPPELDKQKIIDAIDPQKDVDGLTATNIKRLCSNDPRAVAPGTIVGIISLLKHYEIALDGKKVTVIGRSMLVGKPLSLALLNENATVTICHRHTKDLKEKTREADILVVAAGSPNLITTNHVKAGQVIVDVGINFVDKNVEPGHKPENEIPKKRMVGDVDFDSVKDTVAAISPVPGGVGPMTVASLFSNLIDTWKAQTEQK